MILPVLFWERLPGEVQGGKKLWLLSEKNKINLGKFYHCVT